MENRHDNDLQQLPHLVRRRVTDWWGIPLFCIQYATFFMTFSILLLLGVQCLDNILYANDMILYILDLSPAVCFPVWSRRVHSRAIQVKSGVCVCVCVCVRVHLCVCVFLLSTKKINANPYNSGSFFFTVHQSNKQWLSIIPISTSAVKPFDRSLDIAHCSRRVMVLFLH